MDLRHRIAMRISTSTERRQRAEAKATAQRAKALALRQGGRTYAEIGVTLGVSKAGTGGDAKPAKGVAVQVPIQQRARFPRQRMGRADGTSVWRGIRNGSITVIECNGIKQIPRAFAIKVGFITE